MTDTVTTVLDAKVRVRAEESKQISPAAQQHYVGGQEEEAEEVEECREEMMLFEKGRKKMEKFKARRARVAKFLARPRKFKTVDQYITNAKMSRLAGIVTKRAQAYKQSTNKLEELCRSQPQALHGLEAGALLITAISIMKEKSAKDDHDRLPMEAQLAAEDYISMREAMDEFMDEGHVPGSLVMELSRRVLDAEIEDSAPILMAESVDEDDEDESDHDTNDNEV